MVSSGIRLSAVDCKQPVCPAASLLAIQRITGYVKIDHQGPVSERERATIDILLYLVDFRLSRHCSCGSCMPLHANRKVLSMHLLIIC